MRTCCQKTANRTSEEPFVENIGPWYQVKTMAVSVHGNVCHTKGFRIAEGVSDVCFLCFRGRMFLLLQGRIFFLLSETYVYYADGDVSFYAYRNVCLLCFRGCMFFMCRGRDFMIVIVIVVVICRHVTLLRMMLPLSLRWLFLLLAVFATSDVDLDIAVGVECACMGVDECVLFFSC